MLSVLNDGEGKKIAFNWMADLSQLPEPVEDPSVTNYCCKLTHTISVKLSDDLDGAIADAILAAAHEEGIDELWVLDRQFCLRAITEKIERMTGAEQYRMRRRR